MIDLLIDNLDLTIEYTRLNPWVYEHKNEVTNFKHLKCSLGHWNGQNLDQIRLQFNYQLLRGLKFNLFLEAVIKAGLMKFIMLIVEWMRKTFRFFILQLEQEKRVWFDVSYK